MWDLHSVLSLIWAALLAFGILAYVILDGFDLGIGILFLLERERSSRDVAVNTVAPVWDGNETWLVFGGAALYALFPLAYSVVLPALYPLLVAMLLGLILRGVSFEFRFRTTGAGRFWWDWLTPFTLLCGIAVVVGYALLGACWLIWRTEGDLQRRSRLYARGLAIATLALIVIVSLVTPFLHPQYARRWFAWPGILVTSPVPILVAILAVAFWRGLEGSRDWVPLLCAELWFVLSFAGLGISMYPLMVPPGITLYEAASPTASQLFLIVGAVVMIPIILTYHAYAYWIFRGKVQAGAHDH